MPGQKDPSAGGFRELSLDDLEGVVGGAKRGERQESQGQQEEAAYDASWLLHVDALSQAQVSVIPLAEFGKLTGDQLATFSALQLHDVSGAQLNTLSESQLRSIGTDISGVSASALSAVVHFSYLADQQLGALTSTQLASVTASQIDTLSASQVSALGSHVADLSSLALASLDATQITGAALSSFGRAQRGARQKAAGNRHRVADALRVHLQQPRHASRRRERTAGRRILRPAARRHVG